MTEDHRGSQLAVGERFAAARRAGASRHSYPLPGAPVAGAPDDLHRGAGDASLYLHVPFCSVRCTYCFFVTQIGHGADDMARYVDEIKAELVLAREALAGYRFTSVYFGGGTPGLLPPAAFSRLFDCVAPLVAPGATITVETHPHAADAHRIRAWRACGVDRVSLGVQTTDPALLRLVHRENTEAHIYPALERLLSAGFRDVNVDMLYGLPEQSMASWLQSLEDVVGAGAPSLSIYRTGFIPQTREAFAKLGAAPPSAVTAQAMYACAYNWLNEAGFAQPRYGSSYFSKRRYRYGLNGHRRHVLDGKPMIGLGMGAFGTAPGYTYVNHRERAPYQAAIAAGRLPVLMAQPLPAAERPYKWAVETWKLAFLPRAVYRATFGEDIERRFGPELTLLEELGEIVRAGDEYRLTPTGASHPDAIADLFVSPAARAPALQTPRGA